MGFRRSGCLGICRDTLHQGCKTGLIPLHPLRQIGDDGDRSVGEADGASVLAGDGAVLIGQGAVFQRQRTIQPILDSLGGTQGFVGFLLEQRQGFGGQSGHRADRHGDEIGQTGTIGDGHCRPPFTVRRVAMMAK